MFLLRLYFILLGASILGAGLFGYLANRAKSYQEEIKWTDYLAYSAAVTFALLGGGILVLMFTI